MKKIFTIITLLTLAFSANATEYTKLDTSADNVLYIEGNVLTGSTGVLNVYMKSTETVGTVDFQFFLPEGFTLINTDTQKAKMATGVEGTYSIYPGQSDGSIKNAISGMSFNSSTATLIATIPVEVTAAVGTYKVNAIQYQMVNKAAAALSLNKNVYTEVAVVDYNKDNYLTMADFTAEPSTDYTLGLNVICEPEKITDMEFDITVPDFLTQTETSSSRGTTVKAPEFADEGRIGTGDHSITLSNGHVTIAATTTEAYRVIGSGKGVLVNFFYTSSATLTPGTYSIVLSNIKMQCKDGKYIYAEPYTVTVTVPTPTKELTLDETSSVAITDGDYTKVTVNRTMAKGYWNTLVLPFAMTAEQVAANKIEEVKALSDVSVNGQTYNMTFESASVIKAGQPYMVKVGSDYDDAIVVEDAGGIAVNTTTCSQSVGDITFQGTFAPINVPESLSNFVVNENKFYPVDSVVGMKGFRAYFNISSANAKVITWNLEGGMTEIGVVNANVNGVADGKYLKNGNLVIVKNGKQYNASGTQMK